MDITHVSSSKNTQSKIDVLANFIDEIRLLFRKDRESYRRFYRILGFYPHTIAHYQQALRHKSTAQRAGKGYLYSNERLEFLGDAILGAVVADYLYRRFRRRHEGFLTNTRSKMVQRDTLNKLAKEIGLDRLIQCSSQSQSHNSYLCGNAFEAFVGAIYLDRGYDYCVRFLEHRIIGRYLDVEQLARKEVNFKSRLLEWCQKQHVTAVFELVEQSTDRHSNPTFRSEVQVAGVPMGSGVGYSKKESQQQAARAALAQLKTMDVSELIRPQTTEEPTVETMETPVETETPSV